MTRKQTCRLIMATMVVTALAASAEAGSVLYVDDDASPAGTGQSWPQAFRFLQDALSAAAADPAVTEIRVAQGVYQPDRSEAVPQGTGSASASFVLLPNLALRGGFAGLSGPNPDERNIYVYISELTGDLAGDDPGGLTFAGVNSDTVIRALSGGPTALLQGLRISRGRSIVDSSQQFSPSGGVDELRGRIEQCTFHNNWAARTGGAVRALDGASVRACTFIENYAGFGGGAIFGPDGAGNVEIRSCSFLNNASGTEYGLGDPGGGALRLYSFELVIRCYFEGNNADAGGAVFNEGYCALVQCMFVSNEGTGTTYPSPGFASTHSGKGGAILAGSGNKLWNCRFVGNMAALGGAVAGKGGTNCSIINCAFTANTAGWGGAVYSPLENLSVINSTIAGNRATVAGGAISGISPLTPEINQTSILNSIIWKNVDGFGTGPDSQILSPHPIVYLFSCVQGLGDASEQFFCIDTDPLFVDLPGPDGLIGTVDDDVRLHADSPCVDRATHLLLPPDEIDLDGDGDFGEPLPLDAFWFPRMVDGDGDGDAIVDIGAHEFQPPLNR